MQRGRCRRGAGALAASPARSSSGVKAEHGALRAPMDERHRARDASHSHLAPEPRVGPVAQAVSWSELCSVCSAPPKLSSSLWHRVMPVPMATDGSRATIVCCRPPRRSLLRPLAVMQAPRPSHAQGGFASVGIPAPSLLPIRPQLLLCACRPLATEAELCGGAAVVAAASVERALCIMITHFGVAATFIPSASNRK